MNKNTMSQCSRMVERLVATRIQILITSNPRPHISRGGEPPFDGHLTENVGKGDSSLDFDRNYFEKRLLLGAEVDVLLRDVADTHDLPFLDLRKLARDETEQRCDGLTPEGYKAYYDSVHWTLVGAAHFGAKIANPGWLSER